MARWSNPQGSSWAGEFQYVCFNDGCPYYVRGWNWMKSSFNVDASYRYRLDPVSGGKGPLAVWSASALREGILPEEKEESNG